MRQFDDPARQIGAAVAVSTRSNASFNPQSQDSSNLHADCLIAD